MNTNKKCNEGGGAWASRKLLAALAVLAVAFVVLAAVPAVATDSDAADAETADGFVAASLISDDATAKSVAGAITGNTYKYAPTLFVYFHTSSELKTLNVTYEYGEETGDSAEKEAVGYGVGAGNHVLIVTGDTVSEGQTSSLTATLKNLESIKITLQFNDSKTTYTKEIAKNTLNVYQDVAASRTITISDNLTISGQGKDETALTSSAQTAIAISMTSTDKEVVIEDIALASSYESATATEGNGGSYGIVDSKAGTQNQASTTTAYGLTVSDSLIKGFSSKLIYLGYATPLVIDKNTFEGAEEQLYTNDQNGAQSNHKDIYGGDFGVQIRNQVANASITITGNIFTGDNGKLSQIMVNQSSSANGVRSTGSVTISGNTFDSTPALGNISVGRSVDFAEDNYTTGQLPWQEFATVTVSGQSGAVVAYRGSTATNDGKSEVQTNASSKVVGDNLEGAAYGWDLSPLRFTLNDAEAVLAATYADNALTLAVSGGSVGITGEEHDSQTISVAKDATVASADIVFTAAKQTISLASGAVFNGTVSYTSAATTTGADAQTSSVVLKNIKSSDDKTAITAGSIEISGAIEAGQNVTITATGDVKISGAVSGTGSLTVNTTSGDGNTVTISDDLTIDEGATLTVASGAKVVVASGKTVSGEGKIVTSGSINNNGTVSVSVTAEDGATFSGTTISTVTYSDDAIKTVNIAGGEIANATYGAAQRVEVTADTTVTGNLDVSGVLHVNSGVTLTIASTGSVIIKGASTSIIEGTLVLQGDDTNANLYVQDTAVLQISGSLSVAGNVEVEKTATIQFMAGSDASVGGTFKAANAVIEDSASLTVTGAIASIDGSTESEFKVSGTLIINTEDVSDSFVVDLESSAASVDVERIVMKDKRTITVNDKGKVTYSDSKDTKGTSESTNSVAVTLGALYNSNATQTITSGSETVTADNLATLTGLKVSETMKHKDATSSAKATDTYTMVLAGTIAVAGSVDYDGLGQVYDVTPTAKIEVKGATAASVGEVSLGTHISLQTTGTVSVDGAVSLATISAMGVSDNAEFLNSGELTVKAAISAATVAGAFVNKIDSTNGTITMSGSGSIAVLPGSGSAAPLDGTVNGAAYKVTTTTTPAVTVWYYVTVGTAIAKLNDGTSTAVTLYGKNVLDESATIPAKASVVFKDATATLAVGKEAKNTDVVLTVADGAKLGDTNAGVITVNGSLYAEKIKDVSTAVRGAIVSDVYSYALNSKGQQDTGSWARWTNLVVALNEAESGQKVVVNEHKTGDVALGSSVTVKDGVTLDMNGKTMSIGKDVVLTVAGTLDLTDGAGVVLADSTVSNEVTTKAAGKIDVTSGYIVYDYSATDVPVSMASGASNVTTVILSGAYYSKTVSGSQYKYYTTYSNGAADILNADDREVVFDADGAEGGIVVSDLAVSGEKDKSVTVEIKGDLTAGTITLAYATLSFTADSTVSATIADASGSVAVKAKVSSGSAFSDQTVGSSNVLTVAATISDDTVPASGSASNTDVDTTVSFTGTVYVVGALTVFADKAAVSGDLVVYGTIASTPAAVTATFSDKTAVTVDGSVSVQNGSTLNVKKSVAVSGTLSVVSGQAVIAVLELAGTVSAVAEEDATASVVVDRMYAGITEKAVTEAVTGADLAITGKVSINTGAGNYYAVVKGVSVPEAWTTGTDAYKSTIYNVNGSEYATVYAPQNSTALVCVVKNATVENAYVQGWANSEGEIAAEADNSSSTPKEVAAKIGADGWKTVDAKVKTDIFTVKITADGGVNYVTIGGKLLTAGSGDDTGKLVISDLVAGAYDVVISPKSGYDTSKAALYNKDGSKIDGLTITVSGTPTTSAGVTLEYSIVGSTAASTSGTGGTTDMSGVIDAINKNTDAVKEQDKNITVNGGSDDNDLTNILLVVLVILIIVMAILVAMRMMRS